MTGFFGELYLRSTLPFLSPEKTEADVAYLARAFGRVAPGPILDVGCGHGRHAAPLARRGFRVVGLELDPLTLRERESGFPVARGDFRAAPFRAGFAVAYAWYSTLFIDDAAQNARALASVAGCLKPQGTLLFHTVPRTWLEAQPRATFHGTSPDGWTLEEENTFDPTTGCDTGRRRLLSPDGRTLEGSYCIRYYTPDELQALAAPAGLRVAWVHGDRDGGPLTPLSSEVIVGFARVA